ncbi:Coproporphyrinogen oxidase (NAD) [uncultured Desulfobacterium sp.]|uniref:Coproporphyrinogen oxidase (NAD) n=1 Tax=uncultured Desulfobacterium sp. TaxID=201089 RepID=A0A445N358_9BACT|nr:Coproporphyrinogen oxidase (NAD) [uncultured Desulfobacterium sp.]
MMQYESPPIRPPSESRSLLVRATRYCPWGRCIFCYGVLWDYRKLELRQVEDIKRDILAMKSHADMIRRWAADNNAEDRIEQLAIRNNVLWLSNEGVKTAFIGDSDSLVMKVDDLVEVIEFMYKTFPTLERVTSYARAKTALKKTPESLKRLHEAGLSRLHLGLETGDDQVLKFIDKGVTSAEMIEAGRRIRESGISLSEYVLLGIGGQQWWQRHAEGTARVLNAIDPDFIRARTLIAVPGTPLYDKVVSGEFKKLTPAGILKEERLLIDALDVTSEFVSDHVSNYLPLNGKLPEAKAHMLQLIDKFMAAPEEVRDSYLQPEELRHP